MKIKYNVLKIEEILSQFFILTGISVSLYDVEGKCIACPKDTCSVSKQDLKLSSTNHNSGTSYCEILQHSPNAATLCDILDRKMFEQIAKTKKPFFYTCHAGLIESVHPVIYNNNLVAFLMMGKFIDNTHTHSKFECVMESAKKHNIDFDNLYVAYKRLPSLSEKQIKSASFILNLFISYFFQEKMIQPQNTETLAQIKEYITEHLSCPITVNELCNHFFINPNKLYSIFKSELNTTIKSYILTERINAAKKLLKNTSLPIPSISEHVGIADYSYFIRLFKKHTGISPLRYRKSYTTSPHPFNEQ